MNTFISSTYFEFNPDLVLVSAGFDAAVGDPLGNFHITPSGFAQMTKMLSSLANGKIILALEVSEILSARVFENLKINTILRVVII